MDAIVSSKTRNFDFTRERYVCVSKQHHVSIFFTRLWSVRKPLLFDTQDPEISGFSTAHAYKYKTKRQAKMKRRTAEKWYFCWLVTSLPMYLKSRGLHTDHKRVKKSWNVVLFCYTDKRKMRSEVFVTIKMVKKMLCEEGNIDMVFFFKYALK